MTDLDDINRRMAQALGYEYRTHSPDWSQWWCRSVPDGGGWYKAPGEQSWTCAACHGFPPAYATDWSLTGPLMEAEPSGAQFTRYSCGWFAQIRPNSGVFSGPTILIAFCLAYLARHEAKERT